MKRVALDASVILKWYLPDESYGEKACLSGEAAWRKIICGARPWGQSVLSVPPVAASLATAD
jgi:hypothetical protein